MHQCNKCLWLWEELSEKTVLTPPTKSSEYPPCTESITRITVGNSSKRVTPLQNKESHYRHKQWLGPASSWLAVSAFHSFLAVGDSFPCSSSHSQPLLSVIIWLLSSFSLPPQTDVGWFKGRVGGRRAGGGRGVKAKTKGEGRGVERGRKERAWMKPNETLVANLTLPIFVFSEERPTNNTGRSQHMEIKLGLDPGKRKQEDPQWMKTDVKTKKKESKVGRREVEGRVWVRRRRRRDASFLLRRGELLHPSDLVQQLWDEVLRGERRDKTHESETNST